MAEKRITVNPDGTVSDMGPTVEPGDEVFWDAANDAFEFRVEFTRKVPFGTFLTKWMDKHETGKHVDGKVKRHGPGKHRYPYEVSMTMGIGPHGGPELIVDGGEGIKHKKKKAKKAAKAAKKTKKTKKTKKVKSLSRTTMVKKKSSKARKSRAAKKR